MEDSEQVLRQMKACEHVAFACLRVYSPLDRTCFFQGDLTISPIISCRRGEKGAAFWVAGKPEQGLQTGHFFLWPRQKESTQMRIVQEIVKKSCGYVGLNSADLLGVPRAYKA